MEKLSPHIKELQIVQNSMVRVILGLKQANHVNMSEEREKNRNVFSEPNGGLSYRHGGVQHNQQESF